MRLNVIHLEHGEGKPKHRQDRWDNLMKELAHQNISEYKIYPGIVDRQSTKRGISNAHKAIIKDAKEKGEKICIVAEDDICFTGTFAWEYYLDNMPKDFDVYVASYYSGSHDENFVVTGLRGMTLYTVAERYYDTFLSLPEHLHIDGAIAVSGAKVIVSPLFCATQMAGYSDQRKRMADDSHRLKGKEIFK